MLSVTASVDIPVLPETVYRYLQSRYDRGAYRSTSLATKGYVPNVTCLEAEPKKRLVFHVRGREPFLRIFIGGWTWIYEIDAASESASRVRVTYRWSWWMSLLGLGTVRHQACNEIAETAMALDALGWARGEPGAAPDGGRQSGLSGDDGPAGGPGK
jgi:hypothetical protein